MSVKTRVAEMNSQHSRSSKFKGLQVQMLNTRQPKGACMLFAASRNKKDFSSDEPYHFLTSVPLTNCDM